jgi:hypothetical protein
VRFSTIALMISLLCILWGFCLGYLTFGSDRYTNASSYTLPIVDKQKFKTAHQLSKDELRGARVEAKYKIVVIDTGYNADFAPLPAKLCKTGHYDFYTNKPVLASTHPHGTIVTTLIATALEDVDYCIVEMQVANENGQITPENVARAIGMAQRLNPTAVNISLSGPASSLYEQRALRELTKTGAQLFVAAGNDHLDLDKACQVFPACYDVTNMNVVGAMTADLDQPAAYTNYGTKVKLWYSGTYSDPMQMAKGTSFASPRALGDYVFSIASPLPTK